MAELVGTSSAERTLDQRDLAALRPARESAPRPRKPRVLREVTSGIVCFCGERFGESQSLEFMLHLRAEVGEHLDQLEKYRAALRTASRRYREANPDRVKEVQRSFRERHPGKQREYERRYLEKLGREEYNRRKRETNRAWRARKKAEREQGASD